VATKKKSLNRHVAYLAYRLGGIPYVFLRGGGVLIGLRDRDGDSPSARFAWAAAEGMEAINELGVRPNGRPGPQADAALLALTDCFEEFKGRAYKAWVSGGKPTTSPGPGGSIGDNDLGTPGSSQSQLADSVTALVSSLLGQVKGFAQLGAAFGELLTMNSPTSNLFDVLPVESVLPAAARLQTVLRRMIDSQELLLGVDGDISYESYRPTTGAVDYSLFAKVSAIHLHQVIIQRLAPPAPDPRTEETWISAMQAHALSEDFGDPLSLQSLSKQARTKPPAFIARSLHNHLWIRLDSFVKYLWTRRQQPEPEGVNDAEAHKRIKRATRRKRKERS
jgi:hypothetical protein